MKVVRQKGFTLIEMMLVLVIMSAILAAAFSYLQQHTAQMRIDRTTLQIQQIQNAALSYYVANGNWPISWTELNTYLPKNSAVVTDTSQSNVGAPLDPWSQGYFFAIDASSNFYVWGGVQGGNNGTAGGTASIIAGTLPLGYTSKSAGAQSTTLTALGTPPNSASTCATTDTLCYAVSGVSVPGQSLNNVGNVNFAGIYPNGGCVPRPACPTGSTPNILVVPASVGGFNNAGGNPPTTMYPLEYFYAYAQTGATSPTTTPFTCQGVGSRNVGQSCTTNNNGPVVTDYWRVCLAVFTDQGQVTGADWSKYVSVMAITRCAKNTESAGTNTIIFSPT